MTKRELAKKYREQERLAVSLYNKGQRLKAIKRRCPMVDGWMVRGLAFAANLNAVSRAMRGKAGEPKAMTKIANPMPLIDQARRTWRNRMSGNPFATDAVIADRIDALREAYLRTRGSRLAMLLHAEIDRLEMLI